MLGASRMRLSQVSLDLGFRLLHTYVYTYIQSDRLFLVSDWSSKSSLKAITDKYHKLFSGKGAGDVESEA